MTKFEDQLFADLMTQYRPVLDRMPAQKPARRVAPRVAWLTGAATAGAAGAVTAAVMLAGGSPAYAVTQNPDGTVTLSVASKAGVQPANARLKVLGDPVVVVPTGPNCPSMASLPHPTLVPGNVISGRSSDTNGLLIIDLEGVPAGDTAIVAMSTLPEGGTAMVTGIISGPVPSCVSPPAPPPAGSGSSSGG
jgi:hypothetical protein